MTNEPVDAWIDHRVTTLIDDLATGLDLGAGLEASTAGEAAEVLLLDGDEPAVRPRHLDGLADEIRGALDLEKGLAAITARLYDEPVGADPVPIVIVDDHELVGSSLAQSLRAEGENARYQPVRTAVDALKLVGRIEDGLVVLDLDLGRDPEGNRIDGVRLVEPLCRAGWRVVVLSGSSDAGRIGGALAAGGFVWVPKNAPFPVLLATIREARQGRSAMPAGRRDQLIEMHRRTEDERRETASKLDKLTPREREVLALLASGRRAQAVADHFVVSLATVRTQIRAVLTKLEVSSQLEAVALHRRAQGR